MKTKLAVLLLAALALGTAVPALAAKGKPVKHTVTHAKRPTGFQAEIARLGMTCPRTTVHLNGRFGSAGDGFMAVEVAKATGKAAKFAGKQVALRLLRSTHIVRNGGATVAAKLKAGDRLSVVALVCSQGLVARTVTVAPKA